MKTKTLWIDFITHGRERTWKWKPWLLQSQSIFGRGGKTWLVPRWEFGWGPLVIHWTDYASEKEYKGTHVEHECPAELKQERIDELENAIRVHRRRALSDYISDDETLWKVLGDDL